MLKSTKSMIDTFTQKVETIKGTPWEEFGNPLPEKASLEETLKLAGLDWGVVKRQAWVDAMKPVWTQFEGDVGAENIAAAQEINAGS